MKCTFLLVSLCLDSQPSPPQPGIIPALSPGWVECKHKLPCAPFCPGPLGLQSLPPGWGGVILLPGQRWERGDPTRLQGPWVGGGMQSPLSGLGLQRPPLQTGWVCAQPLPHSLTLRSCHGAVSVWMQGERSPVSCHLCAQGQNSIKWLFRSLSKLPPHRPHLSFLRKATVQGSPCIR